MEFDFKRLVSDALPFLGSFIGGPLGSQAGTIISKIITGNENASEKEIQDTLKTISTDKLIELKKIDAQYQENILKYHLDSDQMYLNDVQNARSVAQKSYETHANDNLRSALAIGAFLALVGVILIFLCTDIAHDRKDNVQIFVGILGALCIQCFNYLFGTTKSSQEKNQYFASLLTSVLNKNIPSN